MERGGQINGHPGSALAGDWLRDLGSGCLGSARTALLAAVAVTALWALIGTVAGPGSLVAELASSFRNLAWLFALLRLFEIDGRYASLPPARCSGAGF